jgi:hypothetical protein
MLSVKKSERTSPAASSLFPFQNEMIPFSSPSTPDLASPARQKAGHPLVIPPISSLCYFF